MNINDIQNEIIDNFSLFDNWEDRYEYIIDIGKKLPALAAEHQVEDNRIKGCQSTVWLISRFEGEKIFFEGSSDAVIVKGLIGLLIMVLSGHSPKEIAESDLFFIDAIGMTRHLAQTRSNGLLAMVKQMKFYALAYQLKSQSA